MKKFLKALCTVSVIISVLAPLTGCGESASKAEAFVDYMSQFEDDIIILEAIRTTEDQFNGTSNYSKKATYASSLESYADELLEIAQKRNTAITDTELKEIDDIYIQGITEARNSYKLYKQGIVESDNGKITAGLQQNSNAVSSFQRYGEKLDDFRQKYNVDNQELLKKMLFEFNN